jgi:hypothetical protein
VADNGKHDPWLLFNWKQGIFCERIPKRFDKVQKVWMAIWNTMVWMLWMERNDAIFNDITWSHGKLRQKIWLGLIDYGRLDNWNVAKLKSDNKFKDVWCKNGIFAAQDGHS